MQADVRMNNNHSHANVFLIQEQMLSRYWRNRMELKEKAAPIALYRELVESNLPGDVCTRSSRDGWFNTKGGSKLMAI